VLAVATSIERDADAFLFPPDNVTAPLQLIGWNDQRESVGNKSGLTTSSAAPVSERLRTIQSTTPPPDSIEPVFKIRRRGAIR
jgi:hypothetical protein